MIEARRETVEYLSEWRDDARVAHEYADSDQWLDEDRQELKKDQRPALTVNLLLRLYNVISGNEITNRFEGKFLPRSLGSEATSEEATGIMKALRQTAHAEFEESAAFRDESICGVGCVEYHENIQGDLQLSRVPYSEIAWDPGARKMNYDDAEWVMRGRWIPIRKFKEMFPEVDLDDVNVQDFATADPYGGSYQESRTIRSPFSSARAVTMFDPRRRLVLTFEMQKKSHEHQLEMIDPATGETMPIGGDKDYERIAEVYVREGLAPPGLRRKIVPIIEQSWWAGEEKVADEIVLNEQPSYLFMTGFEAMKEGSIHHHGLHHHLKEAQDIVNKAISKMLHILQTAPNNLLMFETGVFDNPKEAQRRVSTTGGLLEMTMGAIQGKRYEFVEGRYPANFERLFQTFAQFFYEISGINVLAAGQVQDLTRVAASTLQQVQQQALTVMSVLYDSLRKYRILSSRWFLDYIKNEVPDQRIFNILNAYGSTEQVVFNKEAIANQEFDVVVSESPSTPSQMIEFWDTITRSGGLDLLLQSGVFTPLEVAKIVPHIPADIRQEAIRRLSQPTPMALAGPEGAGAPPGNGQLPLNIQ